MKIDKRSFGKLPDGREALLFSLENDSGMQVDITNYGGIVTAIRTPDKNREPGDVVLGFDNLADYVENNLYFGALIGRHAGRIAHGKFTLEGEKYSMVQNNGPNHLHGGNKGFDRVLWTASTYKTLDSVSLKLGYQSPDMEEGYPGNLLVEVNYTLNDRNELSISYRATTDKTTVINLTNHSYFNLNNCRGDILDHELLIDADQVTELNKHDIPTGKFLDVRGTCFDFRTAKPIGRDIEETAPGYDINFVLNSDPGELKRIATLFHAGSGRAMDVLTTQPGVQFYSANYVENIEGKAGVKYDKHAAVCLETQHFPDSPNQQKFPSTVLRPDEEYQQVTIYRFKW